ncbi:MAG: hypothetical protein Q9191_001570 [Dirinaria sp. TL-2023a]
MLNLSSLNDTFTVVGNVSTPIHLGLPLAPGTQTLNLFNVLWHQGDSIQSTEAVHVFYNIFIAILACWRTPLDHPLDQTVAISTQRYNFIKIALVPGSTRLAHRYFKPTVAGALLWRTLHLCLDKEPAWWSASLVTRSRTPETVGLVRTEARVTNSSASKVESVSLSTSAANGNEEDIFTDSSRISNITSTHDISEQINFLGPLEVETPRDNWLKAFLLWSSEILTAKSAPTEVIMTVSPDIIRQVRFPMAVGDFNLIFQAKAGDRLAASSLTYDELFRGMQDILGLVIATSQYQLLDAKIYKDGWEVATFRVFFEPGPDSSGSNAAIA